MSARGGKPAGPARKQKVPRSIGFDPTAVQSGFAASKTAVLRYAEAGVVFDSVSGSLISQQYAMNGLFDPNITGVGHQPRYFDQLCGASGGSAIYNRYLVTDFNYKITCWTIEAADSGKIYVNPRVASSSSPASFQEAYERADTQVKLLLPLTSSDCTHVTFTGGVHLPKLLGLTDAEYKGRASEFGALYNANPTNIPLLQMSFMADLAGNMVCYADVVLSYKAFFYARNDVLDS